MYDDMCQKCYQGMPQAPIDSERDASTLRCHYRCAHCGHTWFTEWQGA